jgi:hypothetical protein
VDDLVSRLFSANETWAQELDAQTAHGTFGGSETAVSWLSSIA